MKETSLYGFIQQLSFRDGGPLPPSGVLFIGAIYQFVWLLIVTVIIAMIGLMLVRFVMNYADMNPFSRPVILVRRLTDPLVNPVRRALAGFQISPNGAPLVTILLTILAGYFALMLAGGVLNTAAGIVLVIDSRRAGGVVALVGYLLYGLLTVYSLLIFIRIIMSWGRPAYHNRLMRFLARATDPLLVPLRHMIPPLGMFDISPIVAFIIIFLFQKAIELTLLRGWPVVFFV